MNGERIPVSISKDIQSEYDSGAHVRRAVEYINSLTNDALLPYESPNPITVTDPSSEYITVDDIANVPDRWNEMQVITTDRELIVEGTRAPLGFVPRRGRSLARVAVVSSYNHVELPTIAATATHEIGHLFQLRYGAELTDIHCQDDECVMYSSISSHLLQAATSIESPLFCSPCERRLASSARILMQLYAHNRGDEWAQLKSRYNERDFITASDLS